jgi:hypothetical protein
MIDLTNRFSTLAAVDPGIRGCGVAVFEGGVLALCQYVVNPMEAGGGADAAATMAREVYYAIDRFRPRALVVEWPRVYATAIRLGRSKSDPNDLLALAGVDAAIAALCADHISGLGSVTSYAPSEWKGQVPKEVMLGRIRSKLTRMEDDLVDAVKPASKRHNAIDAVGIGLHHIGRLKGAIK